MKSKTLITMAVASTFGWSAAVFAGPGHSAHEVVTPASPNESGQMMLRNDSGFRSSSHASAMGSSANAATAGGAISGTYSSDELASIGIDESLTRANEGIYSDFYVVGIQSAPMDGWDYYVVDTGGSDQFAASGDAYWLIPTHELALIPSTSDEMIYELVLVPTTFDDMTAGLGSGLGDFSGE